MKKVVYLIGAGAIIGEMEHGGIESDISMTGIGQNVFKMSKSNDGEYYKLVEDFGISPNLDVELMMSLFEDVLGTKNSRFDLINKELRKLFRNYLISQISDKVEVPRLMISLLHIHNKYEQYMGTEGEKMLGILTINYDSIVEEAFSKVFDGLNCGCEFTSEDYNMNDSLPPLLKLHGSFNILYKCH